MKRYTIDGMTIDEALLSLAAKGNRKFTQSLHPGVSNILGLRLPDMRMLARRIAQSAEIGDYLAAPGSAFMESRMLHGLVLGQLKVIDTDHYLRLVSRFVSTICSWSVCDCFDFAGKHRFVKANRDTVRDFLISWLSSEHEYEVRFGVVMLMKYYLKIDGAEAVLRLMEKVAHSAYYVRMAMAWAVSAACATDAAVTLGWIAEGHLDPSTLAMAIRKIRESRRISEEDKARASQLVRGRTAL